MPDFRVHSPAPTARGELLLSPEESHHLVTVNRARAGDPAVAFDGAGREWQCTVATAHKSAAVLHILRETQHTPLPHDLTLAQVLPLGPAMDGIVRKATELGARAILPLTSERSQVHLQGERQDRKREKWKTVALEAAKQCGNPFLPDIAPLATLDVLLAGPTAHDIKLIASLHPGARSLKTVLEEARARHGSQDGLPARPRVLWLIGPEGDFTSAEVDRAIAAGFVPVTLGPLVLRCETAATYALSVSAYALGG